jgi:hypothetical protein
LDVTHYAENSTLIEERQLNNLHILVSDYQPRGELKVYSHTGFHFLDLSSTVTLDSDGILLDQTQQPVSNYETTLDTPLENTQLTRKITYDLNNVSVDQSYPTFQNIEVVRGQYPNETVAVEKYIELPWTIEDQVFISQQVSTPVLGWSELTLDKDFIYIGEEVYEAIGVSQEITLDQTILFYEIDDVSDIPQFDESPVQESNDLLTLELVPLGLTYTDWWIGDRVESAIWFPSIDRGYFPASELQLEMSGCSLPELAISLISLRHLEQDDLIFSTLVELIHLWKKERDLVGLPSVLVRDIEGTCLPSIEKRRDRETLAMSWLGYALTFVAKQLRDKPPATIRDIPEDFEVLLNELANEVAKNINSVSGVAYVSVDEYGDLIEEPDISATVMAELFLQNYLSLNYDLFLHEQAAICFTFLSEEVFTLEDHPLYRYSFEVTEGVAVVYKLLWNISQNIHSDTTDLLGELEESNWQPNTPFEWGLYSWVIQELKTLSKPNGAVEIPELTDEFLEQFNVDTLFPKVGEEGLRRFTLNPDISASSWGYLISESKNIIEENSFNLESFGAQTALTISYQEALRMWPFGYDWTDEQSESAYIGNVGSLMYAYSKQVRPSYLAELLIRKGFSISTSVGYVLNLWGEVLRYPRPTLQSDDFYRTELLKIVQERDGTITSLRDLLERYGVAGSIQEPELVEFFDGTEYKEWKKTVEVLDQITEQTDIKIKRSPYPTSDFLTLGETKVVQWDKVAPILEILINEGKSIKEFEKQMLNNLSAGVHSTIYLRLFGTGLTKANTRSYLDLI